MGFKILKGLEPNMKRIYHRKENRLTPAKPADGDDRTEGDRSLWILSLVWLEMGRSGLEHNMVSYSDKVFAYA